MAKNKKPPMQKSPKIEAEKKPRYLREVAQLHAPTVVRGLGNPSVLVSHIVAELDGDGVYIPAPPPNNVRAMATETYVWNQDHRSARKAAKGLWKIPNKKELQIFKVCRRFGWLKPWKTDRWMGWGIMSKNQKAEVVGLGLQNEPVKVCKFLEGNKGVWHGFPINYREKGEEIICDHALAYWARWGIIDKSDIGDIKWKLKSPLV